MRQLSHHTVYCTALHYMSDTEHPSNKVNHKIMDASSFLMALLLCVLLQETALGSAATQIYMETTGVCVAPGDAFELYCTLRSASRKDTQVSFGKGSTPINDTSHTQVLAFTPMCRQIDSDYKWDLKVRLTVHAASVTDGGVYWCRAVENGITYTSSATVFVQRQSEFELATNLTANLGETVTVPLDRKCDHKAPVRVTRTSRDGIVEELPYRYSHEGYQNAYVDKLDGALIIPNFKCTDAANYNFNVMASRGLEPVSTSKSIDINASCKSCCPEDAVPVTPTLKTTGQADTGRKTNEAPGTVVAPNQMLDAENQPDNGAYIVIGLLVVWGIAAPLVVHFWHRRKNRRSSSTSDAEDGANGTREPLNIQVISNGQAHSQ
ncbi:uncharacterized protein LOC119741159 [Patiria miniata]|uniref:Ig-like domain-containing protein n=1 Tax=Patiria miniata TaxID=46514 RepID=A0A914B9W4_PATMI|nr:uncharacterized protein LOC119741159 [Patiria miniata]